MNIGSRSQTPTATHWLAGWLTTHARRSVDLPLTYLLSLLHSLSLRPPLPTHAHKTNTVSCEQHTNERTNTLYATRTPQCANQPTCLPAYLSTNVVRTHPHPYPHSTRHNRHCNQPTHTHAHTPPHTPTHTRVAKRTQHTVRPARTHLQHTHTRKHLVPVPTDGRRRTRRLRRGSALPPATLVRRGRVCLHPSVQRRGFGSCAPVLA